MSQYVGNDMDRRSPLKQLHRQTVDIGSVCVLLHRFVNDAATRRQMNPGIVGDFTIGVCAGRIRGLDSRISRLDIGTDFRRAGAVANLYEENNGKGDIVCSVIAENVGRSVELSLQNDRSESDNNDALSAVLHGILTGTNIENGAGG